MAVDVNLGFLGNEIGRRNIDGKTQKKKQTSKRGSISEEEEDEESGDSASELRLEKKKREGECFC